MEKIDTDWEQRTWKIEAELLKPFNRDVATLSIEFAVIYLDQILKFH